MILTCTYIVLVYFAINGYLVYEGKVLFREPIHGWVMIFLLSFGLFYFIIGSPGWDWLMKRAQR